MKILEIKFFPGFLWPWAQVWYRATRQNRPQRGRKTSYPCLFWLWSWKWEHFWLPNRVFPCFNFHSGLWVFKRTYRIFFHSLSGTFPEYQQAGVCMAPYTHCINHWVRSTLSSFTAVKKSRWFWFTNAKALTFLSWCSH